MSATVFDPSIQASRVATIGDSIARDISSPDLPSGFDANWSGKWALAANIGDIPFSSGNLTKSGDNQKMQVRVPSTAGVPFTKGYLTVRLTNASISFSKEVLQEEITFNVGGNYP